MFKRWQDRAREDWTRAQYNLRPRKMDWDENLVIVGCLLVSAYFILLLVEGLL